jgi:Matrixin
MKRVILSILLIGTLLCSGIVTAEQPAKEPVDKLVFIHYKDRVDALGFSASDQAEFYKLYGVKWAAPPVDYKINAKNPEDLVESDVIGAIQDAFNTWDGNTTADLFVYDGETTNSTMEFNEENSVFWGPISNTNVIAVTNIWINRRSREIVETDIQMNTLLDWGIGNEEAFDIQNIITHEAGHVCGLGDLYNRPASELTMFGSSSENETKKSSLGQGDVLGLQKLYGE